MSDAHPCRVEDPVNTSTETSSTEAVEQPPIGGFCDGCGHFAGRHDEQGCHFDRPDPEPDCACPALRWQGRDWPRPWLPAPDGLRTEPLGSNTTR